MKTKHDAHHYDGQMSTRQLTAGTGVSGPGGPIAAGVVVNQYRYDAFGAVIPGTSNPLDGNTHELLDNAYQYSG